MPLVDTKKTCPDCGIDKDPGEFSADSSRSDGLRAYCRACSSIRNTRWRRSNPEKMRASQKSWYDRNGHRVRERYKERTAEARQFVNRMKDSPCVDCGGKFPPVCMDFDHLRDKKMDVAVMVNRAMSISEIGAEIEKCELVCANCHRIRTNERCNGATS